MTLNRTQLKTYTSSDISISAIDPRLLESSPRRNAANVSLSSTVGVPTPAPRRPIPPSSSSSSSSSKRPDISLASTVATSAPTKRRRSSKSALTHPSARALTDSDTITTTSTSTSTAARPRGRPPKSILTTPASRTHTSPNNTVSFSHQSPKRRGRPPKSADMTANTSTSSAVSRKRVRAPNDRTTGADIDETISTRSNTTTSAKRRGRPPGSTNKRKPRPPPRPAVALPKSKATYHTTSVEQQRDIQTDSDVSLIDGISEEDSEASEGEQQDDDDDDDALDQDDQREVSSGDDESAIGGKARQRRQNSKKRKDWPSEKERLKKWRRLSVEERECVTSEGGLIWRTAIPLLNSMPKNIRSMVAGSLTRALDRIDSKLESSLVPPLARIPISSTSAFVSSSTGGGGRELSSSFLSWRLEEEGMLVLSGQEIGKEGNRMDLVMGLGMNLEIRELEGLLLPEAEQIVELSNTLAHQVGQVDKIKYELAQLKLFRKSIKNGTRNNSHYPPNLHANPLITINARNTTLDPILATCFRFGHNV